MESFSNIDESTILKLIDKGYKQIDTKGRYEKLSLKKNANLILYTSKKLVVSGKQDAINEALDDLNALGIKQAKSQKIEIKEEGIVIGGDESLKGDSFGGLTLAVVKCGQKERDILKTLEITDSKKISDSKIPKLAQMIRELCEYRVKSISPVEYNMLSENMNITAMLNHFYFILSGELNDYDHLYIDKYPGAKVAGAKLLERAESKIIEVAAASILAREAALQQFDDLKKQAGFEIPKGSTHVKFAIEEIMRKKLDPSSFLKLSFNNVKCIVQKNN